MKCSLVSLESGTSPGGKLPGGVSITLKPLLNSSEKRV